VIRLTAILISAENALASHMRGDLFDRFGADAHSSFRAVGSCTVIHFYADFVADVFKSDVVAQPLADFVTHSPADFFADNITAIKFSIHSSYNKSTKPVSNK
jgi:hypothetical protein